jgi:hypothetical protein
MSWIIEVTVMIAVVLTWRHLLDLGLHLIGPKVFAEYDDRKRAERNLALRSLSRWKVILIEGVLGFGFAMAYAFTMVELVRSQIEPNHRFHWSVVPANLFIFGVIGIWFGYASWNNPWKSAPGKIGSSTPNVS